MATATPVHTPYDGSATPFTIGLQPLDIADWIELDGSFAFQLGEKRRLSALHADAVFVAEPETVDAQREVRNLLLDHLPARFADVYQRDGDRLILAGQPGTDESDVAPLRQAAMWVQEDLILMRRGDDGWRLAAGSLCFPSSWSLAEKFGKPLHVIHAPVPGFGAGTRPAGLIARMFDNLSPARPVQRLNWSIQSGNALYQPLSHIGRTERAAHLTSKFPDADPIAHAFLRVERQTLRKLPQTGDILFTIRIHLDPLAVLERIAERARLAAAFADQLEALGRAELDYKGLAPDRDRLVSLLRDIAGGGLNAGSGVLKDGERAACSFLPPKALL